jgi:hypothetical protein
MLVFLVVGCLAVFSFSHTWIQTGPSDQGLAKFLDLARKYCARLDKAALDFVCREQVK